MPHIREPKPVLLVNHSPDTLDMYRIGLAIAGFRALLASDAASARRALDNEHPVAVVADLEPGGARDGWELIEAIGKNLGTWQVPIVVLTGRVDPVVQGYADRAGYAVLIETPCPPEELARVLESVSPGPGRAPGSLRILRTERRRHRRGEVGVSRNGGSAGDDSRHLS